MGYRIDQHGLHLVQDKVKAIQKARSPENVQKLQAFLGIRNYYVRFLYNLSTVLAPLHKLPCKEQDWFWGVATTTAALFPKREITPSAAEVLVQ